MKLQKLIFLILLLHSMLSAVAQGRRGRMSMGRRSRYSGLSRIGQAIGKGLQELLEDEE